MRIMKKALIYILALAVILLGGCSTAASSAEGESTAPEPTVAAASIAPETSVTETPEYIVKDVSTKAPVLIDKLYVNNLVIAPKEGNANLVTAKMDVTNNTGKILSGSFIVVLSKNGVELTKMFISVSDGDLYFKPGETMEVSGGGNMQDALPDSYDVSLFLNNGYDSIESPMYIQDVDPSKCTSMNESKEYLSKLQFGELVQEKDGKYIDVTNNTDKLLVGNIVGQGYKQGVAVDGIICGVNLPVYGIASGETLHLPANGLFIISSQYDEIRYEKSNITVLYE